MPSQSIINLWVYLIVESVHTKYIRDLIRPLQFNYLSYEHFLEKKSCQTPKKKEKKVIFGVLRTKVVLKFSVRLQKKKKKSASFKNILCKCEFNQLQEPIIAVVEPQT